MTTKELLRVFLRRWYVVVAGLLVTAGLCVFAVRLVPPTYTTAVSVLLLPPTSTLNAEGNPYRALAGLQLAADVLARSVSDTETVNEIAPPTGTATYEVVRDVTTSGPILLVTTQDSTDSGALDTLHAVLQVMPERLATLQTSAGAPPESLLTMSVIANTDVAEVDRKSQIRAVIVAAVLGLALTMLLAAAIDGALRKHSRSGGGNQSETAAFGGGDNFLPATTRGQSTTGRPRSSRAGPAMADASGDEPRTNDRRPRRRGLERPPEEAPTTRRPE